jgi:hypothetical protein
LDHRRQRLLGHPARLQEAREVGTLPEPRDAQLDRAGARLPVPVAVAIALGRPERRLLAPGGAGRGTNSISISFSAAKPIISRRRSASGVFSTSVRRFIMSSVIAVPSRKVGFDNQTLPESADDHRVTSYTTSRDVTGSRVSSVILLPPQIGFELGRWDQTNLMTDRR